MFEKLSNPSNQDQHMLKTGLMQVDIIEVKEECKLI